LEIPASIHRPGITTATHSLGDEEPERKKKSRKSATRHFSILESWADSFPANLRELQAAMR